MDENQVSKQIVDAAIEVHRTLGGPGLLEDVYEEALAWELRQRGPSNSRAPSRSLRSDFACRCGSTCWWRAAIVEAGDDRLQPDLRGAALTTGCAGSINLVINFGEKLVKEHHRSRCSNAKEEKKKERKTQSLCVPTQLGKFCVSLILWLRCSARVENGLRYLL
jgi:hypothetical protein